MPGDASRGIEVPPSLIQVKGSLRAPYLGARASPHVYICVCNISDLADCVTASSDWDYSIMTTAVLISLPIPDASMPFNVLTLVSTS